MRHIHHLANVVPPASITSPISVLPLELLSAVFQALQDSVENETLPTILSCVSRLWRDVAINNPFLWNRLTITLPIDIGAVAMKLKRSKESLLDLRIVVPYLDSKAFQNSGLSLPSLAEYQDLSSQLSHSYHRCRRLCIVGRFVDAQDIVDLVLAPLRKISMPFLEELTLNGENSEDLDQLELTRMYDLFTCAPKLRDVRLGGYGLIRYRPPIHHVTNLHLVALNRNRYPLNMFTTFLHSIPCLTFLAVYGGLLDGEPHFTGQCDVPNLESLFIFGQGTSPNPISDWFLFLSAPKLRELVIHPLYTGDLIEFRDIQRSTPPLFPNLQTLTLTLLPGNRSYRIDAVQLASRCFPGLKRLVLTNACNYYFGHQFIHFERLFGDSKEPIFSNLRELAISNVGEEFLPVMDRVIERRGAWITTLYMDSLSLQTIDSSRRRWDPYGSKTSNILVEANIWEEQRQRAMYSDDELRFL